MNYDFYTGYEGEPEIVLEHRSTAIAKSRIRVCEGHFTDLLEHVVPTGKRWTGILLHHHLDTGWNEEDCWVDSDPLDTLKQIAGALPTITNPLVREFGVKFKQMLHEVLNEDGTLVIRRE